MAGACPPRRLPLPGRRGRRSAWRGRVRIAAGVILIGERDMASPARGEDAARRPAAGRPLPPHLRPRTLTPTQKSSTDSPPPLSPACWATSTSIGQPQPAQRRGLGAADRGLPSSRPTCSSLSVGERWHGNVLGGRVPPRAWSLDRKGSSAVLGGADPPGRRPGSAAGPICRCTSPMMDDDDAIASSRDPPTAGSSSASAPRVRHCAPAAARARCPRTHRGNAHEGRPPPEQDSVGRGRASSPCSGSGCRAFRFQGGGGGDGEGPSTCRLRRRRAPLVATTAVETTLPMRTVPSSPRRRRHRWDAGTYRPVTEPPPTDVAHPTNLPSPCDRRAAGRLPVHGRRRVRRRRRLPRPGVERRALLAVLAVERSRCASAAPPRLATSMSPATSSSSRRLRPR